VSLATPLARFVRRRGLGVVIVLVWLAMMGRLTHLHDPGSWTASLPVGSPLPEQAFDEWMGIYYQGKKVGYCHRSFGPEGEGWRSQEQMYVEMVAQAKWIAGDEKDSLAVAGLLTRWVHDNLEKRVVPSLESVISFVNIALAG
jgi:hypothetical protein